MGEHLAAPSRGRSPLHFERREWMPDGVRFRMGILATIYVTLIDNLHCNNLITAID